MEEVDHIGQSAIAALAVFSYTIEERKSETRDP